MKILLKNSLSAKEKDYVLIKLVEGKCNKTICSGNKIEIHLALGSDIEKITIRNLTRYVRQVIRISQKESLRYVVINYNDFNLKHLKLNKKDLAELLGTNLVLANYKFNKYITSSEKNDKLVKEVVIICKENKDVKVGLQKGIIIGEEMNDCRDICNAPAEELTPANWVKRVKTHIKNLPIKIKVHNEKEMKKLKMNLVLAVGQGTKVESKFIVLEYLPNKKEKPLVFVGKGVTFDSGGLDLKNIGGFSEMHMDMVGGATVISAIVLAAKFKIKKNIVVLVPAVENSISSEAFRPTGIVTSMSGKTVEIEDMDAEGRLILADGLEYAKKYKPNKIISVATLTGGAIRTLGLYGSPFFATDNDLANKISNYSEETGERIWRLPLWEEYEKDMKSDFADFKNLGTKPAYGSCIKPAVFLKQFVKDYSFVHFDIAPRVVSVEGDNLAKGAIGEPVQLLLKLMENI